MERIEGANDGLVSVNSSMWGEYKGTLVDCSHLDLINWTSKIRWYFWKLGGNKRKYVSRNVLEIPTNVQQPASMRLHSILALQVCNSAISFVRIANRSWLDMLAKEGL